MDFPHIKDTQFPHVDNIDVYKYQNNFQYERWQGKVSFKLLNVLWNSNYADVPYFDTDAKRDEWFDSQQGYVGTLESLFNNTPENTVKIPIPYNDAYNYNYLVVDMPMQTSENQPINYENKNIRVKRWFYFIEDMVQTAPSTTELQISVDYWTTFINSVDIPYLMLERGHAPMTKISVEQFLANPIANNEYLLADDFNYGNESIIQSSNYIPIGSGKKYVLFFTPISKTDLIAMNDTNEWSNGSTNPTFSNASDYPDSSGRWNYQYVVNNYDWHYGNTDYSNANLPITTGLNHEGLMSGLKCYAIEGQYASSFFEDLGEHFVHFIHSIVCVFILSEEMFSKGVGFTFRNKTLYEANKLWNGLDIQLSKALFKFDSKYADITKLYTSPYSIIEITDDYSNTFTAKIENCGNLRLNTVVSLVYPYLEYVAFLTGVNGDTSNDYIWKTIEGNTLNLSESNSDFQKYMMRWNVPTYALFVSAEEEKNVSEFAPIQAKRQRALVDYHNAVRYADNTSNDSIDVADVNRDNTIAMSNTNNTNVYNNANNIVTNQGIQNQCNTDVTAENVSRNDAIRHINNVAVNAAVKANNDKIYADVAQDNSLCYTTSLTIDNAAIAATTAANTGNMWAQGVIQAVGSGVSAIGAGVGGNAEGTVNGLVGVGTSLFSTGFNVSNANCVASIQMGVNVDTVSAVQGCNNNKASNAADCNLEQARIQNDVTTDTNIEVNDALTNNTATQNTAAMSITTNTSNTMKTNADNLNSTETSNANALESVLETNAIYDRNANVIAEQDNLRQTQNEVTASYLAARLQKPTQYSLYGGDGLPDSINKRGIRFNVRTQSKAAISQAGDAFLRFGYALHRVWDMSQGFHYCKNFTFWKAEDIWINDGSGVANVATNIIGDILLKGVTVWRDPKKIGTVGIYDNI